MNNALIASLIAEALRCDSWFVAPLVYSCGHRIEGTYRPGKCEYPICAGDRAARAAGRPQPPPNSKIKESAHYVLDQS